MDLNGRATGLGIELLTKTNYKVWRSCIESYLVGEDLWQVVSRDNATAPANNVENAEALKHWTERNAKAEFILKQSISHGIFEHIVRCKTASEIWQTLDKLYNKKDVARLQMLSE